MKNSPSKVDKTSNPTYVFIVQALDMSWRLAIVVLVPIIGGFELDQHLNMEPWLTIGGFLLAMAGVALVLLHMLRTVNGLPAQNKKQEKHL